MYCSASPIKKKCVTFIIKQGFLQAFPIHVTALVHEVQQISVSLLVLQMGSNLALIVQIKYFLHQRTQGLEGRRNRSTIVQKVPLKQQLIYKLSGIGVKEKYTTHKGHRSCEVCGKRCSKLPQYTVFKRNSLTFCMYFTRQTNILLKHSLHIYTFFNLCITGATPSIFVT